MDKPKNNEVRDVLDTKPRWLIRHGISLLFGLLLLLFTGSYFVCLPDIRTADAVLLSTTEPNDSTVWRLRLPQSLHSFLSSGQSLRLQFGEPHSDWSVSVVEPTLTDDVCELVVCPNSSPPFIVSTGDTAVVEIPCQVEITTGQYRLGDKLFRPFGRLF